MRELKFRAWNILLHEYIPIEEISISKASRLFFEGEIIKIYAGGRWFAPEECIIEQYTGLKDKNGKEIYEGDIVDYNDDGECIGVVEYDAPEFCLNADATNWVRMFLKGAPHQRVIGNIHENPELLEGKL